jgi:hypothetical protein
MNVKHDSWWIKQLGFRFFLVASVLGKNWVVSISPEDLSMFFMEQGRRDREFGFLQWDAVFNYLLCANLCWFGPFWMRFPLVTSHDITCFAKTITLVTPVFCWVTSLQKNLTLDIKWYVDRSSSFHILQPAWVWQGRSQEMSFMWPFHHLRSLGAPACRLEICSKCSAREDDDPQGRPR